MNTQGCGEIATKIDIQFYADARNAILKSIVEGVRLN